jgi:hypothetical protein
MIASQNADVMALMEFEGIGKSFIEKKVMKGITRRSVIEV